MASDKEVEAAARAIYEARHGAVQWGWDHPWRDDERENYRNIARAALEAAERERGDEVAEAERRGKIAALNGVAVLFAETAKVANNQDASDALTMMAECCRVIRDALPPLPQDCT